MNMNGHRCGPASLNAHARVVMGVWLWAVIHVAGCSNNGGDPDPCAPVEPMGGATTVSYAEDVRPLLSQNGCLSSSCHGGPFPSSRYDLRTYEASFTPGDEAAELGACPIVAGDPDSSFLIEKLHPDPRLGVQMPFLRPVLPDEDIDIIATWIREGAQDN